MILLFFRKRHRQPWKINFLGVLLQLGGGFFGRKIDDLELGMLRFHLLLQLEQIRRELLSVGTPARHDKSGSPGHGVDEPALHSGNDAGNKIQAAGAIGFVPKVSKVRRSPLSAVQR